VFYWITPWIRLPNCWEKQFCTFMLLRTWWISKNHAGSFANICDVWYDTHVCNAGVWTAVFTHSRKGNSERSQLTDTVWDLNRVSRWSDYRKCRIMLKLIEKPASENVWTQSCVLIQSWYSSSSYCFERSCFFGTSQQMRYVVCACARSTKL
jgi:hypothetical protein